MVISPKTSKCTYQEVKNVNFSESFCVRTKGMIPSQTTTKNRKKTVVKTNILNIPLKPVDKEKCNEVHHLPPDVTSR